MKEKKAYPIQDTEVDDCKHFNVCVSVFVLSSGKGLHLTPVCIPIPYLVFLHYDR